jgi:hypothetical protein
MVHKRSVQAQEIRDLRYAQRRDYTKLVFDLSYQDILQGETINRCTFEAACEFLGHKYPMVLPGIISCERGEVLIDSRGTGSYQKPRQ